MMPREKLRRLLLHLDYLLFVLRSELLDKIPEKPKSHRRKPRKKKGVGR